MRAFRFFFVFSLVLTLRQHISMLFQRQLYFDWEAVDGLSASSVFAGRGKIESLNEILVWTKRLQQQKHEDSGFISRHSETYTSADLCNTSKSDVCVKEELRQVLTDLGFSKWMNATNRFPEPALLENVWNARNLQRTGNKTMSHFYVHIPKTGGSYVYRTLEHLVNVHSASWDQMLAPQDRFRPCDQGSMRLSSFETKWKDTHKERTCTMWLSEQPRTDRAAHNYVLFRQPQKHVVSQYFHCKESPNHRKGQASMAANITYWLESWSDALTNPNVVKRNNRFRCYNPTNKQSSYVWNESDITRVKDLEKARTNNTILQADLHEAIRVDLVEKFDVIGTLEQIVPSTCLIFMKYTGWMPSVCDCNDVGNSTGVSTNKTALNKRAMNAFGHGVSHHASSTPMEPYEKSLISRLTTIDQELYEVATTLLEAQLVSVEMKFPGISICRNSFRDEIK